MRRFFPLAATLAALSALVPTDALAQERLLAHYIADLGDEDHRTSSGQRLTSFAALIAQDRANFHRFGISHRHDQSDPIFSDRAMRAQIGPRVMDVPHYYEQYARNVLSCTRGCGTYMVVDVYGYGRTITRITIEVPG
ncbi:hypothetical protein [Litorisediminicola beolgyonensis]|uniref:Uncharacterized protein n=1 Tax=Litorisediminicola beolgyonensis TaxID=1173614 RepID=A0ABW3ZNM7_9RHOB